MQIKSSPWPAPKVPRVKLKTPKDQRPTETVDRAVLSGQTPKPEKPKKGIFSKVFGKTKSVVGGVVGKLKTVDTVGGMVVSALVPMARPLFEYAAGKLSAAGRADSRPLAVWLDEEHPDAVQVATGNVLTKMSPKIEEGLGLNPQELIEAQKALDDILAPEATVVGKQVPQWMRKMSDWPRMDALEELAKTEPDKAQKLRDKVDSQSPYPSFVFLGKDKRHLADKLTREFDSTLDPLARNPYKGTPLENVWTSLAEQAQNKEKLPVYVSRDGTLGEMDSTDNIVASTISSLTSRSNIDGDDYTKPTEFFGYLTARTEAYYHEIQPWIQTQDPELARKAEEIKSDIAPKEMSVVKKGLRKLFGGSDVAPRYWAADGQHVDKAHRAFMSVAKPAGKEGASVDSMCQLADLVTSLDRDLATGVQSQWIRMAKNLDDDQIKEMFQPLAQAWIGLSTLAPDEPGFHKVAPDSAPAPTEIETDPLNRGSSAGDKEPIPYDRSQALGQGIDHLLDGLGVDARKDFIKILESEIRRAEPKIVAREAELRQAFPNFHGTHPESAIRGNLAVTGLAEPLAILRESARPARGATPAQKEKTKDIRHIARRHGSLMTWAVSQGQRYASADKQIPPRFLTEVQETGNGPLMVSEFYQGSPHEIYTPLTSEPKMRKVLGKGDGEIGVSVVLEGGGGKGLAYIESLRQMMQNFDQSEDGKFAIDEYVGTSAGSLTAGFMAAGFEVDELAEAMKEMDFNGFYSDYIWKQGGIDPRARGVNRGGMFSMQQMYKTLHTMLSKKLGIEGRPILMSDLPYKLKVVTTVLNTDLPEDHPMRDKIDKDGQLVYSSDETPNVDAIGAMLASSAFPFFFDPPQMIEVGSKAYPWSRNGKEQRIQNVDGGALNNFPVAEATRDEDTAMAVWSVRYGGLTTLDFDPDAEVLAAVDKENREWADEHGPAMTRTMQQARVEKGLKRMVIGLNLADEAEQAKPILQGQTKAETADYREIAEREGLDLTNAADAQKLMEKMAGKDDTWKQKLARRIANFALDGKDGSLRKFGYVPPEEEAKGLEDVLRALGSAVMWKGGRERLFQKEGA
jgi:predicted acylesterase/phospholipase RssA